MKNMDDALEQFIKNAKRKRLSKKCKLCKKKFEKNERVFEIFTKTHSDEVCEQCRDEFERIQKYMRKQQRFLPPKEKELIQEFIKEMRK